MNPLRPALVLTALAIAVVATRAAAQNDLAILSDEFTSAAGLSRWQRVQAVEGWNIEPLETWDIDVSRPGRMTMMPYTVTWYQDYIGPLAFQRVGGDFVITTEATSTGRDGHSVPNALYSLAGLMMRTPRNITPATWTPGQENYVFLSVGYGNVMPRTFQFEVKTTVSGISTLNLSPSPDSTAELQLARIGGAVIALRRSPGQPWVVHRRYARADFPDTLQVGLVAYTDWGKVSTFPPFVHNSTVLGPPLPPGVNDPSPQVPFAPDLLASFEYARYVRPQLPPELAGHDLTNPAQVTDAQLLSFLGDNANIPAPPLAVDPEGRGRPLDALRALPNPSPGTTRLAFTLNAPAHVQLEVLDVTGRRVRSVLDTRLPAGTHEAQWDGRDDRGAATDPGLYLVTMRTPRATTTLRLARIR